MSEYTHSHTSTRLSVVLLSELFIWYALEIVVTFVYKVAINWYVASVYLSLSSFLIPIFFSPDARCIKLLISWISTVLHFFPICFSCYTRYFWQLRLWKLTWAENFWSNENASNLKNCWRWYGLSVCVCVFVCLIFFLFSFHTHLHTIWQQINTYSTEYKHWISFSRDDKIRFV